MPHRRSVVMHGHFYQPPREDPWTGLVPVEVSAAPFHDWNQRIHDECYRAVVAANVLDGEGHVASVVNTLEWLSWDAGPTLLTWLARENPDTYQAFLDADARSAARLGHGNAIATPYHHVILPLSTPRDRTTEIRWGITDFRKRFGREPEGMWLPEAAADTPTLEALAAEGIRFTVLGPNQVEGTPADGSPGRVDLPSGRDIAVFVYDGGLSHDVAFGALLRDGKAWASRMADAPEQRRLVALATDGETFGHHHRWADMALAAAIQALQQRSDTRLDNFGSFLARNPATTAVTLREPSSWSCAHGIERWRSECGCRMAPHLESQQAWRAVLRDALDELGLDIHRHFAAEGRQVFKDPWAARDAYGGQLDAVGEAPDPDGQALRRFLGAHAIEPLAEGAVRRAYELLEMERDALRMYTSCGWFFDDLAGLEPLQVLRYAAHALDLAGSDGRAWEARLRKRLEEAHSNDREAGNGALLWDNEVRRAPA